METTDALQLEHLIERRRWAEAQRLLERSFRDAPQDPDAHCYAARIARGQGDDRSAKEHLARALAADPSHFLARLLRFDLLFDEKRWGEAEEVILDLLREAPDDADLLTSYGRLMLFTLHLEKARALVAEALRREPDDLGARTLAVLLATVQGDRDIASGRLAELVRDDPDGESTAYALFTVLLDQRRYREALRVGQELLRNDPGNSDLVAALIELRAATHPLALPAYPMHRFGWLGAGTVWMLAIVALMVLGRVAPTWAGGFALAYVGYCIYTWTYGPLLKRWIARRGV